MKVKKRKDKLNHIQYTAKTAFPVKRFYDI